MGKRQDLTPCIPVHSRAPVCACTALAVLLGEVLGLPAPLPAAISPQRRWPRATSRPAAGP